MIQNKMMIPVLLATALATPVAFSQSLGVGAGGHVAAGVQAGPVNTGVQGQTQIGAQTHTGAIHQAADTARSAGTQVGDAVRDTARSGAQAADHASDQATTAVSGNANAEANSAVTADPQASMPAAEDASPQAPKAEKAKSRRHRDKTPE